MDHTAPRHALIRRPAWLLGALLALVLLAPWWRNHHYLRDFFDYGLVMSGVGRIGAGERPYVNFVTPIQTGLFIFNGWFERMGGGDFQAMTLGAAGLILLMLPVLFVLLVPRVPWVAALLLAAALTAMTASQHTILWHNTLGTFCIAVAALGAARAPAWRRGDWPWHLLTWSALLVGGITKINAHLVAVCGVVAWALYAGGAAGAGWRRVGIALLGVLGFGLVAPVCVELAWTGATFRQWWHNVVALPFGSRSGDLAAVLDWRFYFSTRHGYYGALPVPQLGALGVLLTGYFFLEAHRRHGFPRSLWAGGAALFAAGAGAGLLATNYEIAYVALGAWFALIIALWIGFGLPLEGGRFRLGVVAPVLLVGGLAWHSAWIGQRSQFGYSGAPRSEYVSGDRIAPDFRYLRGTFVPPEIARAMAATVAWRAALPPAERPAVFYGPGLEWLERPWPAHKVPGLPLWMHGGTSYGPAESARLLQALSPDGPYANVLVPEAWDHWEPLVEAELAGKYLRHRLGVWMYYAKLPPGCVSWRPWAFLNAFGGNANSTVLRSAMELQAMADGRGFLGVTRGTGEMTLPVPTYRAQAEAVLCRRRGAKGPVPAKVHFEVHSVAGDERYPRWSADLGLAEDQEELVVPFPLDCGGLPLRFAVTIPPELDGVVMAGWRALKILHAADGPESPLKMHPETGEARLADEAERQALLPAGWAPPAIYVRDGALHGDQLVLQAGGELWIRLAGAYAEITGRATIPADAAIKAEPVVRIFYAKGAKLDILTQGVVGAGTRRFDFRGWSAEPGGWLVIAVDPGPHAAPVAIRLLAVKPAG
jgi:hypothetical protein